MATAEVEELRPDILFNGGYGNPPTISPETTGPTPRQARAKPFGRQASEDSRTSARSRPLHPAEKKRAQLLAPNYLSGDSFRKNPAFDRLRRLSQHGGTALKNAGLNRLKPHGHLDYRQIIHRFEKKSSFHGLVHAALAEKSKFRYMWYAAFVVCFIALVIQLFLLVRRYQRYDKTVDLDLTFENAPFPSVTLCNLNPYKASAIGNDPAVKATMDAFKNIMQGTGRSEGIAAAIAAKGARRRHKRQHLANESKNRRYLQVYAQCYCEVNRISGERTRSSCFAAYKGKISLSFNGSTNLHNFHPTRCLCQLDWIAKTLWPCFPYNTWKEKLCTECVAESGHCPMRFYNGTQDKPSIHEDADICLCHNDYNHCIASNENGEIPEIQPSSDLERLDFTKSFVEASRSAAGITTTTTTTQAPEVRQALGFEELKDEIAINTQARQNLMFAVEEKPMAERVQLSQSKHELILKCSFNQRDCDIENDFKQHYDPSYGNCYTFNWNRTKQVTAHRAGANYGLRVLLYANVSEYLSTTEAVGFRITIHDKWIVPFPDAFGHTSPTGFMSSFGVRMKQFYRITPPHGHCMYGGEEAEEYIYKGFNYSVEACHRSCTQAEVIRLCGCADPMYPVPKQATSCKVTDPEARDCIKNTTQYLGRLIADGHVPNCKCHQPCTEIGYEVSYSAARWPSGTTKLMECEIHDDLCIEKYRKNAAMIQVFYEELNYETLVESPAYPLASALADLGGLMGLWIGASVVSLLEVVPLCFYITKAWVKERKRKLSSSSAAVLNTQQPKKKVSISSVSTGPIYKPRKMSTPSRHSAVVEMDEEHHEEQPLVDATSKHSSSRHSTPVSRKSNSSYPYLPPGAELPCTCIYDSTGHIVKMMHLCPVHGYMVRRNTIYSPYGEGEDEQEDHEDSPRVSESESSGDEEPDPEPEPAPSTPDPPRRQPDREQEQRAEWTRVLSKKGNPHVRIT